MTRAQDYCNVKVTAVRISNLSKEIHVSLLPQSNVAMMSTHKFMPFTISLFPEYKLNPFSGIMITKCATHVTMKSREAQNFHAPAHTFSIQISSLLFHRQSLNLVWDKNRSTARLFCVGR
jgi:hypothetical protein